MRGSRALILGLLVVAIAAAGCSLGKSKDEAPEQDTLSEGESLGEIDRLPGGTPVAIGVRTLLTLECANEQLVLRTNLESLAASMPCDRMLPLAIIEQFIGKPVAITYENERLKIANETAGTMELPASEPRITPTDATP